MDRPRPALALIRESGVPALVEQSGGGCATLYVGEPDEFNRFPVIAGPGWFEGRGFTKPRADVSDFSFGPDDDGESEPTHCSSDDSDPTIAARIVAGIKSRTS
jgi:hypothetical protein